LLPLKEAVERASKVYEKESLHPASADIVAQHIGYKSADNGAAKRVLAALGYYGLLERPSDGMLAVNKSIQEYKFAPSEDLRNQILRKWLMTPGVFAELLEKFPDRLPSDASLKYELIQKGFTPDTADECLTSFLESVQYVQSLSPNFAAEPSKAGAEPTDASIEATDDQRGADSTASRSEYGTRPAATASTRDVVEDEDSDRIPVRLAGGRRAWLVIPSPFYAADKRRLISQIDLLLTDDDE
jgi:hypothetical protein